MVSGVSRAGRFFASRKLKILFKLRILGFFDRLTVRVIDDERTHPGSKKVHS